MNTNGQPELCCGVTNTKDGSTLAAMVGCMLADSRLPTFLWRKLMFTEAMAQRAKEHWKAASLRQGGHKPEKEQHIHRRAGNRRSNRRQDHQLLLGLQGQGRQILQGTSRCAPMGTSTRRRQQRHIRSGLQVSEHPYGAADSGGVRP